MKSTKTTKRKKTSPESPTETWSDVALSDLPARSVAAILPAAGSGQRFGSERNKLFAMLAGKPLWSHAVARLKARPEVSRIVMAISEADRDLFDGRDAELVAQYGVELVGGGAERTASVQRCSIWSPATSRSNGWRCMTRPGPWLHRRICEPFFRRREAAELRSWRRRSLVRSNVTWASSGVVRRSIDGTCGWR